MPIVPTPPPENALPPAREAGGRLHGLFWARFGGVLAGCAFAAVAYAGAQQEEQLSDSVRTAMCKALSVPSETERLHGRQPDVLAWLNDMSPRLAPRMPDARDRIALLTTVHYESARAGLDPQLVLGLIHHESGFKKYAVSYAGARGYMQVMPFWLKQLGGCVEQFGGNDPLFDTKANIRFGTVILRYYLDTENGDLYRALGRYNGSLGRSEYPVAVLGAMQRYWSYAPRKTADSGAAISTVH